MIESLSLNVFVCQSFGGTGDKKKLTSAKRKGESNGVDKSWKGRGKWAEVKNKLKL